MFDGDVGASTKTFNDVMVRIRQFRGLISVRMEHLYSIAEIAVNTAPAIFAAPYLSEHFKFICLPRAKAIMQTNKILIILIENLFKRDTTLGNIEYTTFAVILKKERMLYFTICGRFTPNVGGIADYVTKFGGNITQSGKY